MTVYHWTTAGTPSFLPFLKIIKKKEAICILCVYVFGGGGVASMKRNIEDMCFLYFQAYLHPPTLLLLDFLLVV